jgi:hypothetical protein
VELWLHLLSAFFSRWFSSVGSGNAVFRFEIFVNRGKAAAKNPQFNETIGTKSVSIQNEAFENARCEMSKKKQNQSQGRADQLRGLL